ncbi:hypothetical protein D3C73_1503070 [compost metagenome]
MSEQDRMDPVSGEPVETDGIYENEWGRETQLNRGELFPADPQLGTTTWKLVGLAHDTHTGLSVDPRFKEEITYPDRFKDKRLDKGD